MLREMAEGSIVKFSPIEGGHLYQSNVPKRLDLQAHVHKPLGCQYKSRYTPSLKGQVQQTRTTKKKKSPTIQEANKQNKKTKIHPLVKCSVIEKIRKKKIV